MNTRRWHSTLMALRKRVLCLSGSVIKSLHDAIFVFLLVYAHIFDDVVMEINKLLLPHFPQFPLLTRPLGSPCGSWPDCTLACVVIWGALSAQPFCLSSTGLGITLSSNISSRSCHTWQQARICWEPELSRGYQVATPGDASIWKWEGSRSPLAESHA